MTESNPSESFDRLWNLIVSNQEPLTDYDHDRPKHTFLQYLVDRHNMILHGSNNSNLQSLRPFRAGGVAAEQALSAIYATDSAPEAIFFAVLDRSKVGSFSSDTYGSDYVVDKFTSTEPWRDGVVYILSREPFEKAGGYWVSQEPVIPQGAVTVSPEDFPYLAEVCQNRLPWWMQWVFKAVVFWKRMQ